MPKETTVRNRLFFLVDEFEEQQQISIQAHRPFHRPNIRAYQMDGPSLQNQMIVSFPCHIIRFTRSQARILVCTCPFGLPVSYCVG